MITAIYPGTFDPITHGHFDVIERAVSIFEKVIVAVALNSPKQPLFTVAERINQIQGLVKNCKNIEVDSFKGLLVNYAKSRNARVIIRGLRAVTDFEYEQQLALMNRRLNDEIDTVFLMPSERFIYLDSSIVREVARLGGDLSHFVAPAVAEQLMRKFSQKEQQKS